MKHFSTPLIEFLTASSIAAILAATAFQPAKGYLEKARIVSIEEEITNCIKELSYDNVFEYSSKFECPINTSEDQMTLFYNKKNNTVYSKRKLFHFDIGRDIECFVFNNKTFCRFVED